MRVQSINLNLIPVGVMPVLHFSQFDRDVDGSIIYMIYNGSVPFDLTDCEAVLEGTKPDSTVFSYPCTVHNNFLTTPTYSQMTSVLGDYAAEIRISKDGNVVGTLNFIISVEAGGIGSADLSDTEIPALLDDIQNAVDEAEYWAEQAAGAVAGVASFNGRHGSVLPVAGDYDASQISYGDRTVEDALDGMGGHTILNASGQEMPQRKNLRFAGANLSDDAQNDTTNVTITGGSGGSTITVTTIETTLYGETVTITDGTSTFTGVFDNSGVCVISGVTATGTLTVTSGAATRQLTVPYYGNYEVALSFWSAEITVTTDPGVNSAIVKKDGVNVGTISFSAGTGTYIAGSTGAYTFTATVGGVEFTSPTVTVTEQTSYSTSITIWSATLNISTGSSALYGKTITIKKGSTTIGTTTFSAQGSASYTVHETGTYTCECEGYSGSATVSAETTYNVTINAGLDLSAWITAGSTTDYPLNPSSYADFSALEADEAAVRQLMTVHASVDYLATATAGDSLMQSVINSDVCAKWINLSDYALDTLSANTDIKSVMDAADKYGYGEWVYDGTSWGPKGNVPIMTANNAPYGVASAYQVFDGNASTSASGTDFSYQSVNPICVKRYKALGANGATITGTIQGSNDGSTWTNITLASNTTYYMYHRLHLASSTAVYTLQFYGRELKPLVPTMTSNTTPKGVASTNSTYAAAYNAFGSAQNFAFDGSNQYLRYQGTDKTVLKYVATKDRVNSGKSFTATYVIQGSNDGTTWDGIKTNITHVFPTTSAWWGIECGDNDDQYLYHQLVLASYTGDAGQQMTHAVQFYGSDYSEKEFAPGSTRKTIYDHGVAPSGAITGGTKNPDCLTLSAVGTATVTMNKGTRKYMGGKAGLHASGTNRLICGSGYSAFTASNMPDSNGLDISSISGSVAVGIEQTASGTFDCTEIWIE